MNRNEFIANYWKYYTILEADFLNLTRYIRISSDNESTYSDEIIKQLLSVSSEFENICKEFFELDKTDKSIGIQTIQKQARKCNETKNIHQIEITVANSNDLKLKPFENWTPTNPSNLFWWTGYTNIKHNKSENYKDGNFKNLLNALAALYYMELCLAKKIGTNTNDIDVPNDISKLFEIDNFKTKHTVTSYNCYAMTNDDVAELINSLN